MNITIDQQNALYVLTYPGRGVSCHGFANVRADVDALAHAMALPAVQAPDGSIELYRAYQQLVSKFEHHPASRRTWFGPGTDPQLANALDSAYRQSTLVRLFFGDPATGQDSCTENDVVGFIGRSNGTMKVPLLLEAYRKSSTSFESSEFGSAISCSAVLRVVDILAAKDLYRHKNYQLPQLKVLAATEDLRKKGYFFSVYRLFDGTTFRSNLANCKTEEEARAFVAFMHGNRLAGAFRTRAQAYAELEV